MLANELMNTLAGDKHHSSTGSHTSDEISRRKKIAIRLVNYLKESLIDVVFYRRVLWNAIVFFVQEHNIKKAN